MAAKTFLLGNSSASGGPRKSNSKSSSKKSTRNTIANNKYLNLTGQVNKGGPRKSNVKTEEQKKQEQVNARFNELRLNTMGIKTSGPRKWKTSSSKSGGSSSSSGSSGASGSGSYSDPANNSGSSSGSSTSYPSYSDILNSFDPTSLESYKQMKKYTQMYEAALGKKFSYNPSSDPLYSQMSDLMDKNSSLASRTAMEELNSRGILNSTITSDRVGQITKDNASQLNTFANNLRDQSYNQYQANLSSLKDMLAYSTDTYNADRNFGQSALQNQWSANQWQQEYDTNQNQWNQQFNYTANQDAINNDLSVAEAVNNAYTSGLSGGEDYYNNSGTTGTTTTPTYNYSGTTTSSGSNNSNTKSNSSSNSSSSSSSSNNGVLGTSLPAYLKTLLAGLNIVK